jgi:hypothetical protein
MQKYSPLVKYFVFTVLQPDAIYWQQSLSFSAGVFTLIRHFQNGL